MFVAQKQKEQIDFLRSGLLDSQKVVSNDMRPRLMQLTKELDQWAARVAVVGQVKAGKSSFLNAFLGETNLLPSDVNPWTSVVTNLRINVKDDPQDGASFEFFGEEDWDEIIAGGSEIRQMAEKMLPGFDADLLRQQSAEMRARAERRLGDYYQVLLGSTHDYDFCNANLLQRYVCAGPEGRGNANDEAGRYSTLTKSANVYMNLPEFQVPCILTDTPGVNDPFLVRDEVTCRSLDNSDFFIVVLSAHQALTSVDTALIQILAAQENKDLIVFINRIDELDAFHQDTARVVEDVRARLHENMPDVSFTIQAGSAYWAELALRDDPQSAEARAEMDTQDLHNYLQATFGHVPADQRRRFALASGVPAVKEGLSGLIDAGAGCHDLKKLFQDIRAEISTALLSTRKDRMSLQSQVDIIANGDGADALKSLEAEIAALRASRDQLIDLSETGGTNTNKILSKFHTRLEREMNGMIDSFITAQYDVLKQKFMRTQITKSNPKLVSLDLLPLRMSLEDLVRTKFATARASVDVALESWRHAGGSATRDHLDGSTAEISLQSLPFEEFSTTLILSKQSLDIKVKLESGWAIWKRKNADLVQTLEDARVIAAAELRPALTKILQSFDQALIARSEAGANRLSALLRAIESALAERQTRLQRDRAMLMQVTATKAQQTATTNRLHSQLEVLEKRLQQLSIFESEIEGVSTKMAA